MSEWILNDMDIYECSNCGNGALELWEASINSRYCPHCGKEMSNYDEKLYSSGFLMQKDSPHRMSIMEPWIYNEELRK